MQMSSSETKKKEIDEDDEKRQYCRISNLLIIFREADSLTIHIKNTIESATSRNVNLFQTTLFI